MRALIPRIKAVWADIKNRLRLLSIARSGKSRAKYLLLVFGRNLMLCIVFFMLFLFLIDINFLWLFGASPSLDELEDPYMQSASELYTADGQLLGRYYTENRSPVDYDQISPMMVKALIATEDVRFYDHTGIDWQSIPSIVIYAAKGDNRGGSTITQQLAKNLYKTRTKGSVGLMGYIPGVKTVISKSKEWITAIKLERRYSKDEIITMYLNTVDFGANSFGIKTASRTFFSTTPDSLSIPEAAMLVGLLKAPTLYSPIKNPKNALMRRNTVMSQMVKYGVLEEDKYAQLSQEPIELKYHVEKHYDGPATYFRGVVNNYLRAWCKKHGYDLYSDGLKIYTTIDSRLQNLAEEAVEERMKNLQVAFDAHWRGKNPWVDDKDQEIPGFIDNAIKRTSYYKYLNKKYKNQPEKVNEILHEPKRMRVFSWKGEKDTTFSTYDSLAYYKRFLRAGFMVMDPFTSQIKAWVGGINYKYFQYDHVRQAKRQPGSTFKPFVSAAAFENGWGPCDKIVDQRVNIRFFDKKKNKDTIWSPHNADHVISGANMTLRRAMGKSVNTVTAQLCEKIGWETVIEYAHRMGIRSPLDTVPSVALGSSDVSLYELVGAYTAFLNEGITAQPSFVTRIVDRNGKIIHQFSPKRKRALSVETAWLMLHMLKGTIEEPGGTVQNLWSFDLWKGNELAGKTGTSSNHSDGWFVGVSKDLIAGAWVGGEDRSIHFRTSSMGEGSKTALPIFGIFMEKVYADPTLGITHGYFPKPPKGVIKKNIHCRTVMPRNDSTAVGGDSSAPAGAAPLTP
ncbi:MAG: transglycosylase domain-containing protein [Bacteroidia bacterium]